jgi:heme exporter protein D
MISEDFIEMGEVLIPYIWAATGLVMLVAIVLLIGWAHKHNQFDEHIKDQIFTEGDDDRFDR